MTSVFGLEPTNKIALTNLKVKKRSGGTEDFSLDKIVRAIKKCFQNNLNKSSSESEAIAESIGKRVRNILIYEIKNLEVDVEEIQKLVIQQLWASDFSDAAEKYTIFREQRKIERLNRPRSPEEVEMIKKDTKVFPAAYQYYQLISKYVRWNYEKERRETWQEVVDRVMGFFKKQPQLKSIPEGIWGELQENLFYLKSLPAMRIIQMAGPPLERCNVGAYNCSYLESVCKIS
jgi:transcriptional regulator NrdR family protein